MPCLHIEAVFVPRDFLVIREGSLNFIAAPKYAEADGTVLVWVPVKVDDEEDDGDSDDDSDDDASDGGILLADCKVFRRTPSFDAHA